MAAFAVFLFLFSLNASANRQVCDFQGTSEQAWEILAGESKVDTLDLQAKEEFLNKAKNGEHVLVVYETPDGKYELRFGSPAELQYNPMVEAKGDCPTAEELKAKSAQTQPEIKKPEEENLAPQKTDGAQGQKTLEPTVAPQTPDRQRSLEPGAIPLSFGEQRGLQAKRPSAAQTPLAKIPKNFQIPPLGLEQPPEQPLEIPANQETNSMARAVSPARAQRYLYPDVEVDPTPLDPVRNINPALVDNALKDLLGTVAGCLAGANFKETPYTKIYRKDPFAILFCMVRARF